MSDDSFLVELRVEQMLMLVQLLEQKINANQDVRIKAAYIAVLRSIQDAFNSQATP